MSKILTKLDTVMLRMIKVGQNTRVEHNYQIDGLYEDIVSVGLTTRLLVAVLPEDGGFDAGMLRLCRGHRRLRAIARMETENPTRYKELFGKGIDVEIREGLNRLEIEGLKIDAGNTRGLSDPQEIQRCANILFSQGLTEAQVAIRLQGVIESVTPMRPVVAKEIVELKAEKAEALQNNCVTIAASKQKEIDERVALYYHGRTQALKDAWRCPAVVMACLENHAEGTRSVGFEKVDFPILTTKDYTKLWKAFEKDLGIMADGQPKYNRDAPGPNFETVWMKLVEASQSKTAKVTKPKPKSMPSSEITAEITGGTFRSELATGLCNHHAGDKSVDMVRLQDLDLAADAARKVEKYDPGLWKQVVKSAAGIIQQLKADEETKTEAVTVTAKG